LYITRICADLFAIRVTTRASKCAIFVCKKHDVLDARYAFEQTRQSHHALMGTAENFGYSCVGARLALVALPFVEAWSGFDGDGVSAGVGGATALLCPWIAKIVGIFCTQVQFGNNCRAPANCIQARKVAFFAYSCPKAKVSQHLLRLSRQFVKVSISVCKLVHNHEQTHVNTANLRVLG
jgi:hypothetical protein